MPGTYAEHQIRLQRDALDTPWGFRLLGGNDFQAPLQVQRVFVGSPADGELHRGDIIVAIENYDAAQMPHKQALDFIKNAGGSLTLRVRTSSQPKPTLSIPAAPSQLAIPPTQRSLSADPRHRANPLGGFSPKPVAASHSGVNSQPCVGADFTGAGGGHGARRSEPMLNRVQQSLNNVIWQARPDEDGLDEPYEQRSMRDLHSIFSQQDQREGEKKVRDIKKVFSKPNWKSPTGRTGQRMPTHSQTHSLPRSKPSWAKPAYSDVQSMSEPGWSPGVSGAGQASWKSVQPPSIGSSHQGREGRPPPVNVSVPGQMPARAEHSRPSLPPAWRGTLKSSGAPRLWEIEAQDSMLPPQSMEAPRYAQEQQPQMTSPQQMPPPQQMQSHGSVQPHAPRVQNVHYAPGATGPEYQQHGAGEHDSDTAQVMHLQYNTPIGLYSRSNVEDALQGQTSGMPGEGTLSISGGKPGKVFDPATSDVFRLILEEEERAKKPKQSTARQQNNVANYEHSPSMQALEAQYGYDDTVGASDF